MTTPSDPAALRDPTLVDPGTALYRRPTGSGRVAAPRAALNLATLAELSQALADALVGTDLDTIVQRTQALETYIMSCRAALDTENPRAAEPALRRAFEQMRLLQPIIRTRAAASAARLSCLTGAAQNPASCYGTHGRLLPGTATHLHYRSKDPASS